MLVHVNVHVVDHLLFEHMGSFLHDVNQRYEKVSKVHFFLILSFDIP